MEQFLEGLFVFLSWQGGTGVLLFCILMVLLRILWHHGKMHEIAKLHLLTSIPIEQKIGPSLEALYGEETPYLEGRLCTYLRKYTKKNL